jgi:hypothetical protein
MNQKMGMGLVACGERERERERPKICLIHSGTKDPKKHRFYRC